VGGINTTLSNNTNLRIQTSKCRVPRSRFCRSFSSGHKHENESRYTNKLPIKLLPSRIMKETKSFQKQQWFSTKNHGDTPEKVESTSDTAVKKKSININFQKSFISSLSSDTDPKKSKTVPEKIKRTALQTAAGPLYEEEENVPIYIPQVPLHESDGRRRKRILVLCTGGTLTMKPDPNHPDGALIPLEGSLTEYMSNMKELQNEGMPEVVAHEYSPLLDSADLGPPEWAVLAEDIKSNYYHFDGFVVLMGTDTMAYTATAISFMLENLNKAVVFTGSQIPLNEPYNDARRNLIMALIFASRESICEVSIFFHDRLLRACRATKVNTHRLLAFDTPNLDPLATIGITIDENESLLMPYAKGALRVHTEMETKILSLRLVPGYDDDVIEHMIASTKETQLKAIILQLYGTGNLPSAKSSIIRCLQDASEKGILVVASTQCFTGSVMMGHYATGRALKEVGVVSAADMTLEAISCKLGYLFGRGDLTAEQVGSLLPVSLRGEVTPAEALSPPPLSSTYQRASRKGKIYF